MLSSGKRIFTLGTISVVLLVLGIWFATNNKLQMGQADDILPSQEQTAPYVPTNFNDELFVGLAVFPTWNALEPATFPLTFEGEAKGLWFFEGSFPVEIRLPNGEVIARGIAQTSDSWMTEDVISFTAQMSLVPEAPEYIGSAALVLQRNNPSDLQENDAHFTTMINIDTTQ